MDFRVLGQLEIHTSSAPIDVKAQKLQAVLAALLLNANNVTSTDRLSRSVWAEPPAAAAANMRTYLARLRRLLEVPGERESRIRRVRGSNYLLHVGPGELDVDRFEILVEEGCEAISQGRLLASADRLERALRTWRGPALDGIACGPELRMKVAWLEERRLAAGEQYAHVQLRLGRHEPLVDTLRDLLVTAPLAERLWVQLMRALHCCGRSHEALEAYAQARTVLAERLGADPGPELQRLHAEILHGAAAPAVAAGPVVAGSTTGPAAGCAGGGAPAYVDAQVGRPPRQLPAGPGAFCGRADELELLGRLLFQTEEGQGPVVLAIDGVAGVGKSSLAIQAARHWSRLFPDGQLYINLQGATPGRTPLAPSVVLGRFLGALGVDPAAIPRDQTQAAALFRERVADRRLLVVLDDASSVAQVRPLLPGGPGCAALITIRQVPATLTEAVRLPLSALPLRDATTLLGLLAGEDRAAADLSATARLAELCATLPFALSIAGARLAARPDWTVAALADRLARAPRRLDELTVAGASMRASLDLTYRSLTDDARLAFRRLSLATIRDLTPCMLAALLDAPPGYAQRLLDDLLAVHLVELVPGDSTDPRYRPNELVSLFGRERSAAEDTPAECWAALRRLGRILHRAGTAEPAPGSDGPHPEWDADLNHAEWCRRCPTEQVAGHAHACVLARTGS